jgi:hypothetical protein
VTVRALISQVRIPFEVSLYTFSAPYYLVSVKVFFNGSIVRPWRTFPDVKKIHCSTSILHNNRPENLICEMWWRMSIFIYMAILYANRSFITAFKRAHPSNSHITTQFHILCFCMSICDNILPSAPRYFESSCSLEVFSPNFEVFQIRGALQTLFVKISIH